MSAPDRTIAVDDWLTQRVTQCLPCGRRSEYLELLFVEVQALALLTGRWVMCRARDPDMRELLQLLERRYESSTRKEK
jgi:hypothetical protein